MFRNPDVYRALAHRRAKRWLLAQLLSVAALAWSPAALAQSPAADPTEAAAAPGSETPAPSGEVAPASDETQPRAQSQKIAADALFRQGRELMEAGKFDEACPRFQESNALDFAVGTLMNLALCYKQAGRTASAWSAYRSAAAAARDRNQAERQQIALKEAADLEQQLSYLVFKVESPVANLQISLDGTVIVPALWGTLLPVDPGEHQLEASAAGYKPRLAKVTISETSAQFVIKPLEPAPAEKAAPGSAAALTAAADDAPPRTAVIIAASVTTAFAIGAAVTGGLYLSKRSDFRELNNNPDASPAARQERRDQAETLNLANLVLTGSALLAAGVTAYFSWDTKDPVVETRAGLKFIPQVGTHHAAINLAGDL